MEKLKTVGEATHTPSLHSAESATTVASTSSWNRRKERSWWLSRWFQFLLQQYKADEVIDIFSARLCLVLYFAILSIGLGNWSILDLPQGRSSSDTPVMLLARILICLIILGSYAVIITAFFTNSSIASKPSYWILASCILKYVHWYLTLPSCFLLFSQDLFGVQNQSNTGRMLSSWLIIIFGLILIGITLYMRSEFPSNGKLNTPNRLLEFCISGIVLLLILINRSIPSSGNHSVYQFVTIAVHLTCAAVAWWNQVFWSRPINAFYNIGHAVVAITRLVVLILSLIRTENTLMEYLAAVGLCAILLVKLGHNLNTRRIIMRVQACATGSVLDNFVLYMSYDLSKQADDASGEIHASILFELSQIGRVSSAQLNLSEVENLSNGQQVLAQAQELEGQDGASTSSGGFSVDDPVWLFYKKTSSSRLRSAEEYFIKLILQLLFLGKNIMSISTALAQYRRLLGSKAHQSLDLFIIEAMLTGRMEHLSVEDSSTQQFSRTSLAAILGEISKDLNLLQQHNTLSSLTEGTGVRNQSSKKTRKANHSATVKLDLSRVLVGKLEYLLILSEVNKLINIKTDIFSNLFEKHDHKSSYLYNKNLIATEHGISVDKAYMRLLDSDLVPNYVFASAVSYFLKIRFDIQRAERLFKTYQNRLSRYQMFVVVPPKEINETNFQYNSLVMRINIAHDSTLGMITDISPNYGTHLGMASHNEATSVNLNSMFPGKMEQAHVAMMKRTADQPIFNNQKEFQLNGFDGFLKPIRYILKLDPLIGSGLHSIALLRFKLASDKCLLLTDNKLDLLSAEADFWKMKSTLGILGDIQNIQTLSESLSVHLLFTDFLKTMEGGVRGAVNSAESIQDVQMKSASNNVSNLQAKSQVASNQLAKDTALNYLKLRVIESFEPYESCGVYHQLSENLGLSPEIQSVPVLATNESISFGEETYYRVWLKFDNNLLKQNQTTAELNTQMLVATQNYSSILHKTIKEKEKSFSGTDSNHEKQVEQEGWRPAIGEFTTQHLGFSNSENTSAISFEKILRRAKDSTPILTLLQEVSSRPYPEHLKKAFEWLNQHYNQQDRLKTHQDGLKIGSQKHLEVAGTVKLPAADSNIAHEESEGMNYTCGSAQLQKDASAVYSVTIPLPDSGPARKDLQQQFSSQSTNPIWREGSLHTTEPASGVGKKQVQSYDQMEKEPPGHKIIAVRKQKVSSIQTPDVKAKAEVKQSNSRNVSGISQGIGGLTLFKKQRMEAKPNHRSKQMAKTKKDSKEAIREIEAGLDKEESFSDHKSHASSKLSQLARNMFGFRNGRASKLGGRGGNTELEVKEDMSVATLTKLSVENAIISHDPVYIHLITKYISDFKLIRKADTNPDAEKNASISSQSTNSRGSHFLKMVNSIMDTKKGGNHVYVFSLGLIAFSLYFGIVLQYVLSSLKSYNVSNLNNFILLSNFIFLDRKLLEICETQDFLYEHTAAAWNYSEYDMIRQNYASKLPPGVNSTSYLFDRMYESMADISNALRAVTDETINLIDKKDAGDVVAATFKPQALDYTDRLSTTSDVYKSWVMPYFSTVNYYLDVFSENTRSMSEIHKFALNNNFDMTLMNSSLRERWNKVGRAKIGLDSTVFNKVLKNMGAHFRSMVDSIIMAAIDRHFKDVYVLLYVSIGVVVALAAYGVFASLQINSTQQDLLFNYTMLKPWELYLMVEELSKERTIFTKFALNEIQLINQYLDFNLFSSLAMYANRTARLQEIFMKDKERTGRIKKFTHDFFFFSSKFVWVIIVFTCLTFGLMGLAIYIFLSINNNRIGVENLLFDSHLKMIDIMQSYMSTTLLSVYGYFLPVAGNRINPGTLNQAFDQFLVFQTGKRKDFYGYFGTASAAKIDTISFNDICSWMQSIPSLKDKLAKYVTVCRTVNSGSAANGIIGFFQFQKFFIDGATSRIVQNNAPFLEASTATVPSRGLVSEIFSPASIEMRIGNWIVFNIYYYVMSEVATETVTKIMLDLEFYVGKVIQYVAVGFHVVLLLLYWAVIQKQTHEIEVCYETFKLVDPFFLMNNRYLQFRFKSAFRGVA